ncbi:MAG: TetR/AcrR family transcriptional regulator [Desulfovibrio sp.]|nr:TetR/AcrR family transcriptional regulator [Desulfovibrio sp.]MBI4960806.1 TetR/AcrR family transcriptional regulator [Desulfovibrio sp.]
MPKETIGKIVSCAIKLCANKGIANVSINDISEKAGIAAGTVMYHFKTKNNLLFVAARSVFYELFDNATIAIGSGGDCESIIKFLNSYFDYAESNIEKIIYVSRLDPFFSLDLKEFPSADLALVRDRYLALMVTCLQEGVSSGRFKDIDPKEFAALIWATLRGVSVLVGEGSDIRILRRQLVESIEARMVC